jgi:hypothetical protein
MNITDITLHAVGSSPESGFLTAVIRIAPSVFATGGRELLHALERSALGDMRKLEKISIQQTRLGRSAPDSHHLQRPVTATTSHSRHPTLQADLSKNKTETAMLAVGRQLQKKSHTVGRSMTRHLARTTARAILTGIRARTREDDDDLCRWREGNKDWSWIFSQFPNRTPGAVRTRWYTKFQ